MKTETRRNDPYLALKVFITYSEVPRNRKEQEDLIRIYYDIINDKPLARLPDKQIFSITRDLFWNAYEVKDTNPDILAIINTMGELEKAVEKTDMEILHERLCIQLENIPDYLYRKIRAKLPLHNA